MVVRADPEPGCQLGYIDPTHLLIYLTNDVVLYSGQNLDNCSFGFHGANEVPSTNNGPPPRMATRSETFAWASYLTPGYLPG